MDLKIWREKWNKFGFELIINCHRRREREGEREREIKEIQLNPTNAT